MKLNPVTPLEDYEKLFDLIVRKNMNDPEFHRYGELTKHCFGILTRLIAYKVNPVRGLFFITRRDTPTTSIDAVLMEFFCKSLPKGYQREVTRVLAEYAALPRPFNENDEYLVSALCEYGFDKNWRDKRFRTIADRAYQCRHRFFNLSSHLVMRQLR